MTDLANCGLVSRELSVQGRWLICTVDFESFGSPMTAAWTHAMEHWARRAALATAQFEFFISVEDAVRLAVEDPRASDQLGSAARALQESGAAFHPHNHHLFDTRSGDAIGPGPSLSDQDIPYGKRRSMYYDVVRRNSRDLGTWIQDLMGSYRAVLTDWGCVAPDRPVFRAGGWDYGDSCAEIMDYLLALTKNGLSADSSASRGVFGTKSWRLGAPFGRNVMQLRNGLVEWGPNWPINCGLLPGARDLLADARRNPRVLSPWSDGVLVMVVHFDHLFHAGSGGDYRPFSIVDRTEVESRIDRFFDWLAAITDRLHLRSAGFESVGRALIGRTDH